MVHLLTTDHLNDQLAALSWLQKTDFVSKESIAVQGNSFGGIETLLGIQKPGYCAAVDASGGAESWDEAPELQAVMKAAINATKTPVFFFQAENDYNLVPNRVLSSLMKDQHKPFQIKTYPAYGESSQEGHSFPYRGSDVWMKDVMEFLKQHCHRTTG